MSGRRAVLIPATLLLLGAAAGCDAVADARSQFGTTDTLAVPGSGSGLMLGLQAPGTLRSGEEGVLRIAVTNHSDTLARHVRLELIVPGWAEPMPPRAGDREVGMAALPHGERPVPAADRNPGPTLGRDGTVVVWFADEPGITFALDAPVPGTVAELRQSPGALPGTARVTRWWVRLEVDGCPR